MNRMIPLSFQAQFLAIIGALFFLNRIDLASAEFGSHLEPFLHEKMQHFMHELVSFAKSPYDMIAYDNRVRYDWPDTHPQAAQGQASRVSGEEITDTGSQSGTLYTVLSYI